MIETPESKVLAKQLTRELKGKKVKNVIAAQTPHGFGWYYGDEKLYDQKLRGKTVGETKSYGGHVEIEIQDMRLDLAEGVNIRFLAAGEKRPPKHQLLVEFTDGTALVCKVQMYGGMFAFREGENDNPYYLVGKEKPDALSGAFDRAYFDTLLAQVDPKKTSAKAFLATEQRIPGLGNGVLQDILFNAGIHPKTKLAKLTPGEIDALFRSTKDTIAKMEKHGGRDTEKDIYGNAGGYKTVMSKNNKTMTCPACGGGVIKEAFMGGSVYFCPTCQPLKK